MAHQTSHTQNYSVLCQNCHVRKIKTLVPASRHMFVSRHWYFCARAAIALASMSRHWCLCCITTLVSATRLCCLLSTTFCVKTLPFALHCHLCQDTTDHQLTYQHSMRPHSMELHVCIVVRTWIIQMLVCVVCCLLGMF